MTRAEVGQAVVAADRLDVGHSTLAAEVAGGSEVHLEGLRALRAAVEVRNSGASHLDVVAAQEEEEAVAEQTDDVGDENELHGTLRPELEALEEAAAEEDADAGTGYGDRAGEDARLTLAEAELRLEVLGQEDDEARDDHQLHTGTEARHHVHRIAHEPPHASWNVCNSTFQKYL